VTAPTGGLTRFVIAATAILIVVLGLFPDSLVQLAARGAARAPATAQTAANPGAPVAPAALSR
jgi:hypothetical protein